MKLYFLPSLNYNLISFVISPFKNFKLTLLLELCILIFENRIVFLKNIFYFLLQNIRGFL